MHALKKQRQMVVFSSGFPFLSIQDHRQWDGATRTVGESYHLSETCLEIPQRHAKSCPVKFTRLAIKAGTLHNSDGVITITPALCYSCMYVCISSHKPQYLPVNEPSSLFYQNHKLGHRQVNWGTAQLVTQHQSRCLQSRCLGPWIYIHPFSLY